MDQTSNEYKKLEKEAYVSVFYAILTYDITEELDDIERDARELARQHMEHWHFD